MGEPAAASGTPVIVLRVTVRVPDLEAFIERYSQHIDGDRIFIFTQNPQPPGTRVRFTLQLASGEQLIHGNGTVTRVQQDTGDRRRPSGMELVYVPLDDRSHTLVDFLLATRDADAPPLVRALAPSRPQPPPPPPAEIGRGDSGGIDTEDASPRVEPVSMLVTSTPSGARIMLDGKPRPESTPAKLDGLDPTRSYDVELSLKGFRPWSRKVQPEPGEKLLAMMVRVERVAEVTSQPAGAELFLDGKRLGRTPFTVRRLAHGRNSELEVRLAGFATHKRTLTPDEAFESQGERDALALAITLEPEAMSEPETMPEPKSFPEPEAEVISSPLPAATIESVPIPVRIAEHMAGAQVAPEISEGPAPEVVEKWREPLPPGSPAAGTQSSLPANPFGEVSDGAIEYFVEWSLEQSIGPRAESTSRFSNVAMELPGLPVAPPPQRPQRRVLLVAGGFAAGMAFGGLALWLAQLGAMK